MKVEFVKSAQDVRQAPPEDRPEVALAGRSNAGKSSFLNALSGRKIAKVSGQPGKTRLLNFFNLGPRLRLTDMPGYGYASRSKSERVAWGKMIESYLLQRESLRGLILILDIRRDWAQEEEQIGAFCVSQGLPYVVVLTKADKMSRGQQAQRKKYFQQKTSADEVFVVSNLKKQGHKDVERFIFDSWMPGGGS